MYENGITLLGGGLIGASWAALFLSKGARVTVYEPKASAEDEITAYIKTAWADLAKLSPLSAAVPWAQLSITTNLRTATKGCARHINLNLPYPVAPENVLKPSPKTSV